MAADLPLFWWVIHYLRRRDTSMRATFGLVPGREGWAPLLGATLALIAVALVGDTLIDVASRLVHIKTHWTDGFTEELLWAGRAGVVIDRLRRHGVGARRRGAPVPRAPLRDLAHPDRRAGVGAPERGHLHAAAWLRDRRIGLRARERPLVGRGLRAHAEPLPGLFAHAVNNLLSTLWTVGLLR